MAPTIHCIRHGQGLHNVSEDYSIRDPILTALGEEQATVLRKTIFAEQTDISLIVTSPMSRTIQTSMLVFQPSIKSGTRILALPDLQEISDTLCDTGSDPGMLKDLASANNWPIDLSLVHEGWNNKTLESRYSPASSAITLRAHDARLFLRNVVRGLVHNGVVDAQIAVVAHGSLLHYLADDWEDAHVYPGTGWKNCEVRSYQFEFDPSSDFDDLARLIETMESRQRRGKSGPMFSREKQPELFRLAMQRWEDGGVQRPDKI